jgi:Ca-activated chloride channel family protein
MKIKAEFTYEKVALNKENDLHLVVSLAAPPIDWQKRRAPICVIPAVDVSGSMTGLKMEYTKQTLIKMVDHLQPGDFMGLVSFAHNAVSISPPVEITQTKKDELKTKIGELSANGSTNFSGGLLMALAHGHETDLPAETQVRIVMLTDGQPTVGVATRKADLVELVKKQLNACSVSAFGYGADADQDLLNQLSAAGKGNYAFIKQPEDALAAFGKELGGLLSTYATNIEVKIAPHNGHLITNVLSDVDVEEKDKGVEIKLSDILAEETRNLVFAVKLSEQKKALPREVNAFDVTVSYETIDEKGKKQTHTEEVKAKIQFTKEADVQAKPTKTVDSIVALAQLAQKQVEAEKLAEMGNFQGAAFVMNAAAADFGSRGLYAYDSAAKGIGNSMSSTKEYKTSGGLRSSVLRSANRQYSVSSMDADAGAMLASLDVNVSNASQSAYVNAFTGNDAAGGGVVVTTGGTPFMVKNDETIGGEIDGKAEKKSKAEEKSSVKKSKSSRW